MLAGPMPTPAVAYLTRALRLSAGVVISASHNPYDDNGIKFFSAQGNKLPDAVEAAIEAELDAPMCLRDVGKTGQGETRWTTPPGATSNFARAPFRPSSICAA